VIESTGTTANESKNAESVDSTEEASPTEQKENTAEVDDLKKRIQELEAQVKEKENKYLYLYADFENFKKRSIKERSELIKFGWESVARELLQTLDNLERAIAHIPPATEKVLVEGLNMVLNQMKSSLQKSGVQHIDSLQKDFDPNLHEAVGQEPSEHPSGVIVKEHTRGYTLHGRLLRPARVIVSGGQSNAKSG
jgi:molecular chaperone GrpE